MVQDFVMYLLAHTLSMVPAISKHWQLLTDLEIRSKEKAGLCSEAVVFRQLSCTLLTCSETYQLSKLSSSFSIT